MKKFIRHFVSFFLVAVMIVSSNITAFAANEKPVDSRFLPEITYTEDNNIEDDIKNTFDFFLHHNIKVKKFKKRSIRIDGRLDVRIKTDYDEKRKAVIPATEIKSMKNMENMESGKTVKRCIRY